MRHGFVRLATVALLTAAVTAATSPAGFITSPGGGYVVGIDPLGNLYDGAPDASGYGLRRLSDGLDVVSPGTPRDSYGVAAGTVGGYADRYYYGVSNIAGGSATFGASTAATTSFLTNGTAGPNLLQIDQGFSFAAENVAVINTTVTNVSGASQAVTFRRGVDFDINPTFVTVSTADALAGPITAASFYGFENPNPLAAYSSFSLVPAAGGSQSGDLGGSFDITLGTLAAGESASFNIYYGLSQVGQSVTGLRGQVAGLGASYLISNVSTDTAGTNSAVVAYGPAVLPSNPTPVPATALVAPAALALLGLARRRIAR